MGVSDNGPHELNYEEELIQSIHSASILAATKLEIIQHAVARSPKVCISAHGIQIPSLLDLGSDVMLLRQSYFQKHLLPKIQVVTSEKANAHQLFHLTVANDGQLSVKMYPELDINFLGLKVPNVGVLIIEDPSQVLDKKRQSKLPGIVGWNLIWLSYNAFVEKYGASGFNSFVCLEGVNPLLFSQLCVFHHSNTNNSNVLGVSSQSVSQQTEQIASPNPDDLCKKKDQQNFDDATGHIRQVTVGSEKNPICIPRNSVITVLGHPTKIHPKAVCLVEQAEHHNLPQGIIVNRCVAKVKSRSVSVILINTNKQNVWLQQPLLSAELYIYDHPEVFSLYDEDLQFCDRIKHTIPTMTDKPVYLVHCTIPPQLQGEVHKCLDTWL